MWYSTSINWILNFPLIVETGGFQKIWVTPSILLFHIYSTYIPKYDWKIWKESSSTSDTEGTISERRSKALVKVMAVCTGAWRRFGSTRTVGIFQQPGAAVGVNYPLVMTNITMERSTIFHGKFHHKWWFYIVMLVYQRVVDMRGEWWSWSNQEKVVSDRK